MSDEIHIPEAAKLESEHIHHKHMVQLFFGAALVLIALCATALYITYSYSVWPFRPLSIEMPKGDDTPVNTVPPKTIEERLAELEAMTSKLASTTDMKKMEERRKAMPSNPIVQEKTSSESAINARLKELEKLSR